MRIQPFSVGARVKAVGMTKLVKKRQNWMKYWIKDAKKYG